MNDYQTFLKNKIRLSEEAGITCDPREINPLLKPHQKDIVKWAVEGGRRAVFCAFGLGKTMMQLEILRLILVKTGGGRGLIIIPLGVKQEFQRDAEKLGIKVSFIRSDTEALWNGIYITNYESVREGKLDPQRFKVVSLDEAGILRGFGGTKTFREFMATIAGDDRRDRSNPINTGGVPYRFVATATPSPNEYIELLAYAAMLGIMDVSQAKTRFFKRDSTKADHLTIHPHKEKEFWLWVASWAIFLQKPSDLGYSDEGYELPPLDVRWHEIPSDHSTAGTDRNGQKRLLANAALGVVEAAREKRLSLQKRIDKMMEIYAEDPQEHFVIWHDLENERRAIEATLQEAVTIYGSQDLDKREQAINDFADGKTQIVACKPVMLGSGVNFQRYCHRAIYLGIGFKFNDFIQSVHRLHRFLQTRPVRIDLIYTEAEREVKATLERKWRQHNELVSQMTNIIHEYGLSQAALASALNRTIGIKRQEESGQNWKLINNDSVLETHDMADNSIDLILTSIPFSTQYEYSPSYNDFGHTDNVPHFFQQMDFLTPQLLRILKPGRNLVIHVKDRIMPGGLTGYGFQVVQPFHCDCIYHYQKHGFAYLGMKTIVTDVVRENNQTYRLGWTEQCKDGTRMGVGMPEYLLIFRKPPTDSSKGYADDPVVKSKEEYSRARWQLDAHAFARSNGNRLITPEDLKGLPHNQIYKLFREYSLNEVYDFEKHVAIGEALERDQMLPSGFMLLPPQSWHPDVWTDVTRMRTLNGAQYASGKEMHLCPLQFDIVDRVIIQMSQPGETVLDPFSGLGTVPLRALKLDRQGIGIELNPSYHADAVYWLRKQEQEAKMPTLFDLVEMK
ncbi:MAG: DNA methylase N-4 [Limnochordia bacterium]|nr:DNA methylase N-4 [Limnochordia bacterium]